MAPKKAAAAPKKAAGTAPGHASYQDMIKEAILNLKERNGSSRQAIKKYVLPNNDLGVVSDASFSSHFNRALTRGSEAGVFERPKGTSGPVKLSLGVKKEAKASSPSDAKKADGKAPPKKTAAAKPKTAAAKKVTKPTSPKKAAATKKATATKAAPKATATKKAAPAKTTKAKANSSKPRKSAAAPAAPAVEEKKPVVLGKTKSGRVTKSTAPAASEKKAAATKKAPAAKKAATKKTTPKKAAA